MDPALWELLKTGGNDDAEEIEAIIRLDDPRAKIAGVRIVSRFGPIATCRLRKESILETRAEENVRSLKAPRLLGPELEPEGLNARLRLPPAVLPSDVRRPPGLSLTGAGVVIGIIDWGCDFDHPQFKHPDGSTRLLALWDQRGSPPPQARSYYGYGTVHSNRRINRALAGANPYRALGYHPADADSDGHGAHGTHVMDIAAGNGLGRGPTGVAPKADLIFVHLADRGTGGLANLGDSVRILEALDFVAKVAWPRPWVVNFSVGRHGGPHDGTTLAEMAFDFALQNASNCFLVQSTGNYSGKNIHSSGRLLTGQTRTLSLMVDEADTTPNELEIWYSGGDEFAVRTESPTGVISRWVKLGEQADVLENGRIVGRIYHRASDPNNSDNHLDLFLYVSAPPGVWKVTLKAERISSGGVFHTWLERDEACPGCQTRFSKFDSDNFYTTGTLANSRIPLVIGAYNTHSPTREVAAFSSVGPTRDHRPKPDLCAPGEGVLAARSSPRGASKSPGMFVRKSGTSMASPHVTGAVALCLQGAKRPLWSHEIRELILNNTEPAPASGRDALRYGHGYLDVAKVVDAVLSLPSRAKTAMVYSYASSKEHPSHSKENKMNGKHKEYFDRLEQVIKGTTSRAASERNLLAEILRASGLPLDSNAIDPDKLYQMLAFNRNGSLPAQIGESLTVLARPGEAPTGFPQAGDVLLRVALGEPGLGHVAVISDPTLWSHKQLANAPFHPESQQPGFYATVIEGGAFPHTHSDRFARRILDCSGRVPADQMILRIRPQVDGEDENVFGEAPGMATSGTWSAAQTTAPIFNRGPQVDLLGELENEIILYELAKIILGGLRILSSKKPRFPGLLFFEKQNQEQLFVNIRQEMRETISKIDGEHKKDAWGQLKAGGKKTIFSPATTIKISSNQDLIPILKLLVYHEIIRALKMPDGSDCYYFKENTTLGANTLDTIMQMIRNFRKNFVDSRLRVKAGGRIRPSYHKPTFETESLPQEISGPGATQFAKSVVAFLKELKNECLCRYNCPKWKADTYRTHAWGEFSVDIYLWSVLEQADSYKGFYKENPTKVFMDALNAVAKAGVTPYGRFSWRVIYNDPRIRAYVQKQYGDGRINNEHIANHGPEKIHIHLDVRPVVLYKTSKDEEIAGYRVNNQGRIELINISATDDSNAKKLQALSRVDAIQLQDTERGKQIKKDYQNCVRVESERPGGLPSMEEMKQIKEKCGLKTGYHSAIATGDIQVFLNEMEDKAEEIVEPEAVDICQLDEEFETAQTYGKNLSAKERYRRFNGQTMAAATRNQLLKTVCGFFGPNNVRITEADLRNAIKLTTEAERLNWLDPTTGNLRREDNILQFGYLVQYYLASRREIYPSTLLAAQNTALTNFVNYSPLHQLPNNVDINSATLALLAENVRIDLLNGAPGLGQPANLNMRVEYAIKLATRARRDSEAWSGAFIVTCIRKVAIQLGLENDTGGNHVGRDELLRYDSGHRFYVEEAYYRRFGTTSQRREGTYHAFRPNERVVQIGDIIVLDRQVNNINHVLRFNQIPGISAPGYAMHCDIVVDVPENAGHVIAIGGNLGHSVRQRRYPLNGSGQLVVQREQLCTQESDNGFLPPLPSINNAAGLNSNSTGRIFAVLSPVEFCAVIPGQKVPGGVIT